MRTEAVRALQAGGLEKRANDWAQQKTQLILDKIELQLN
jgi:hypothetical protein